MYYACSENKGADQLRGYPEAGLRLCFRICRLLVFSSGGSILKKFNNCLDLFETVSVSKVFHQYFFQSLCNLDCSELLRSFILRLSKKGGGT